VMTASTCQLCGVFFDNEM